MVLPGGRGPCMGPRPLSCSAPPRPFLARACHFVHAQEATTPRDMGIPSPEVLALSDREIGPNCALHSSHSLRPWPEFLLGGTSVGARPGATWEGDVGSLISYSLRINHPFGVCAPAFLGSTIDPESSRAPLIPPSKERRHGFSHVRPGPGGTGPLRTSENNPSTHLGE
jgi:hypothetical protein